MKDEVRSAVNFLQKQLNTSSSLSSEQTKKFRDTLENLVTDKFQNHWHPNKPLKGNAYRCINIERTQIDPLLVRAAEEANISLLEFVSLFPDGFALWIDPDDVSVRFGTRGSICPIYGKELRKTEPAQTKQQRPHFQQQRMPLGVNTIPNRYIVSPYFCSKFTSARNQQPNFNHYNKENIDRYHWTSKEYMKRTAQVY